MVSQATQDPMAIMEQIRQLIDQYMAIPGDTPFKPILAGLQEQLQGMGDLGSGDQGTPQPGGDLASLMATPDQGTAPQGQGPGSQDIVEEGPGDSPDAGSENQEPAKDFGAANTAALAEMKKRKKGK